MYEYFAPLCSGERGACYFILKMDCQNLYFLLYFSFLLLINLIRKCQHYSLISLPYLISDIDEKLDKRDLYMVKISDKGAGEEYGIEDIPALVYFENGVPEIFTGKAFPSI
jgi:hypothetical protein